LSSVGRRDQPWNVVGFEAVIPVEGASVVVDVRYSESEDIGGGLLAAWERGLVEWKEMWERRSSGEKHCLGRV
jgi:hypothetical protein